MPHAPFNPLDKHALARAVAKALLERAVDRLPPEEQFPGAGIYAVYYTGTFGPYQKVSAFNRNNRFAAPIYVGRAVPKGARKGKPLKTAMEGRELYDRLREHAESIQQAENLALADFRCRYLVAEDIWIPLGERLLIGAFAPLWNQVVDGFGNHDPGRRRKNQWRSDWDVLHPGRHWAEKLGRSGRTPAAVTADIEQYLATWRPQEP
jgi:Eco29kI restriction endonuclease